MKKVCFTTCLLLITCILFSSCNIYDLKELPRASENFSKDFTASFLENYALFDPQLAYFHASSCEVEVRTDNNNYRDSSNCDMLKIWLAPIQDEDKNLFVSASEIYRIPYALISKTHVYQSDESPMPMSDWTVKCISLIEPIADIHLGNAHFQNKANDSIAEKTDYVLENMMARQVERSALTKFENNEKYGILIEDVMEAYQFAEATDEYVLLDETAYTLLIEFEESSNIVWYSYLYKTKEYDGSFYIERQTVDENGKCTSYYGKIPDETTAILKALLIADGWVEEAVEEESEINVSSETTDPSETTADPEITRDEPFGEGASA